MPAGSAAASPADSCPLTAYAPYKDSSYAWNPSGTGISSLDIDIPIFHLEEGLVAATQDRAVQNMQQVGCRARATNQLCDKQHAAVRSALSVCRVHCETCMLLPSSW